MGHSCVSVLGPSSIKLAGVFINQLRLVTGWALWGQGIGSWGGTERYYFPGTVDCCALAVVAFSCLEIQIPADGIWNSTNWWNTKTYGCGREADKGCSGMNGFIILYCAWHIACIQSLFPEFLKEDTKLIYVALAQGSKSLNRLGKINVRGSGHLLFLKERTERIEHT